MNLQTFSINGETILPITLFGRNRSGKVLEYHKKVMDHFSIPINYIECPFPGVSHGQMMNYVIKETIDKINPTYYLWIDSDALFLKKEAIPFIYDMVKNKITVFGHGWMNNHKIKPRGPVHAYASQATLCYSTELFEKLGRPDCDHLNDRSDTAEEITYRAKELGYCVSLLYPSFVLDPNTPLDASCFQGLHNVYGPNLMYHCSKADHPKHEELFVEMAKKVLNKEF
jgi:hypothetical protein